MTWKAALTVFCFTAFAGTSLQATDWPQWRGPNRDGVWSETGLLVQFPPEGPKQLWRVPVKGGYAGPAVAEDRVFVCDYEIKTGKSLNDPVKRNRLTGQERVLCFNAKTGQALWNYTYDCDYDISYSCGPRCTPTVDADRVYTLGAMGRLCCLNAATGKVHWQKDLPKEYLAPVPVWGFCGHPLIYQNLLICTVGGEGSVAVAFDKLTGKEVWKQLSATDPGYCPPSVIRAGGTDQLLIWHAAALVSLNPRTGTKHWSVELKPSYGMSIAMPTHHGDHLYAGGIGWQGVLLKLDQEKPAVQELWRGSKDTALYPANATPFAEQGTLYGCDGTSGKFKAVHMATGKRLWETLEPTVGPSAERTNYGTAFAVKNGQYFYLMSETGELISAKLSPQKYVEVSRAKLMVPTGEAFGRKVLWSHPAFANKCIFVRNDEELACYSLSKE